MIAGLVLLSGYTLATPFRGPLKDDPCGVAERLGSGTVIVGLTSVELKADRALEDAFWKHTGLVVADLTNRPGFLGYSIRRELFGRRGWTLTVWESEGAMDAFVQSRVHREAMQAGRSALFSAEFNRVEIPVSEIPLSWDRALELLREAPASVDQYGPPAGP